MKLEPKQAYYLTQLNCKKMPKICIQPYGLGEIANNWAFEWEPKNFHEFERKSKKKIFQLVGREFFNNSFFDSVVLFLVSMLLFYLR